MTTEMKKNEYKALTLQQKDHIASLMERLDSEKRFAEKLIGEKYDLEKELEALKAKILSDEQLKALQDEAYKAGRACGYEDAESEFEPYKRQEELDALRDELAEIKENRFPCDVYWSATNGEITLYKIPNEIACLNTPDGNNAVLEAFQSNCFGEEWGSYSKLEVVEMTLEMLEEELGEELVERDEEEEEPDNISIPITSALAHKMLRAYLEPKSESEEEEEEPTPKSTKDLVIDKLNEEPHSPVVYLESAPIPELVEGGERRFTITEFPAFELIPEGHKQIVVGSYSVEFTWEVPAGINLNDTETYEFWDRWGCLRIRNKITDEMTEVEEHDETDDFKEAYDLELHLLDEEGCRV
jgi:hypothetical protein